MSVCHWCCAGKQLESEGWDSEVAAAAVVALTSDPTEQLAPLVQVRLLMLSAAALWLNTGPLRSGYSAVACSHTWHVNSISISISTGCGTHRFSTSNNLLYV